jgi:hypothetical protein
MAEKDELANHRPQQPLRFFPWILVIYTFSFFAPVLAEDAIPFPKNSGAAFFIALLNDTEEKGYIPLLPNLALWLGLIAILRQRWILARVCGVAGVFGAGLIGIVLWDYRFRFDIGYYAWLSSMILLVVASFLKSR